MSHELKNKNGMTVNVLALGGIIQRLTARDKDGNYADVVLGFDDASEYSGPHPYFGALIGRFGNRIAHGRFLLDGQAFELARNHGDNHLHGGERGFDKHVWDADVTGDSLRLHHVSPDGDQGYPGELHVTVTYTLGDDDALQIDYHATTSKPTIINLTSHPYFNLAGRGSILDHELSVLAGRYTPVNSSLVPTGAIEPVDGTPFDFRTATAIGDRIGAASQQLEYAGGYDHNFVLDGKAGDLRLVASVAEPASGRIMEVLTTEPGLQFYSGNSIAAIEGKSGALYGPHAGFCLETQHYPDSPNHPNFPSTMLEPGAEYRSTTIYRFSTINTGQ
ncbi:MAG: galactose mutarotase [Woeseiaceae bacterium]